MFKVLLIFTYLGSTSPPPDPFDKHRTAATASETIFHSAAECEEFRTSDENRAAVMGIALQLGSVLGRDAQFMVESRCQPVERHASLPSQARADWIAPRA